MTSDILDYRRQARGPRNYMILWVAGAVLYAGWAQGWPILALLLCGPCLAMILVRVVVNRAEGFRMTPDGLEFYEARMASAVGWDDVRWVTIFDDGAGGARCLVSLGGRGEAALPAASGFAPDRLAAEFERRGVSVRRGGVPAGAFAAA